MQIVDGIQAKTEDLVGNVQVTQVGPGEMPAGVAGAVGVHRPLIPRVDRALDVQAARGGEEGSVPGIPGRQDAVEHVHAAGDAFQQILGGSDSHEIPRGVVRPPRA